MKKTGIKIAAFALLLPIVMMSCKKDYTCTCTSTNALGVTSTQTYELNNQTRIDAADACENLETDNAWTTRNCNL